MNNKNKLDGGFGLKIRKNKRLNDKQTRYLKKHFGKKKQEGK